MRDVTAYLLRKQETLQERMGTVMGGKVLPLPSDRLREVEATATAKGKVEGKAEGKAEDIMDLLSDLGEVPKEMKDKICAEKNLETLRKIHKLAAKATSIEEFQDKLSGIRY